jgi:hypothetical protein
MDGFQPLIWETFVIRLRREAVSGTWRGQIVHLPDRETASFTSLAQAEDFIRRFAQGIEGQAGSVNQGKTHIESPPQDE